MVEGGQQPEGKEKEGRKEGYQHVVSSVLVNTIGKTLYVELGQRFLGAEAGLHRHDNVATSPYLGGSKKPSPVFTVTKEKYKLVALKVKPVIVTLPKEF